tara:strand:+ start:9160 stop:9981 length:822 start_codon:yes stop_codon:yes gene_type:complete
MKIPFLRFSPEYSVAVDAPKLSPWLKEGLGGTGAECIDISDMNVIEAANKVRSSIQALVLQDADDDRAESIIAATLPKLIIRIQPRRSFSDPLMFENYELAFERSMSQDSFGSPFIGWITVSVFAPPASQLEALVPTHGPTAPSLPSGAPRLWDVTQFDGLGYPLDREDEKLKDYLSSSIQGRVPLPLQAGLPSMLPNEPLSLTSGDDEIIGYIASATNAPGQFMALSQVDVATILGYSLSSDAVRNIDLSSLISQQVAGSILRWIHLNVSNE